MNETTMNLTQEQRNKINAFIAEKRGWTNIIGPEDGTYKFVATTGNGELHGRSLPSGLHSPIPDYCASLDACHEAEPLVMAMPEKRITYAHRLMNVAENYTAFRATSEQRALALFQTLGGQL